MAWLGEEAGLFNDAFELHSVHGNQLENECRWWIIKSSEETNCVYCEDGSPKTKFYAHTKPEVKL
jgi:hypothetical protein